MHEIRTPHLFMMLQPIHSLLSARCFDWSCSDHKVYFLFFFFWYCYIVLWHKCSPP